MTGLAERQDDLTLRRKGPAVKAAFDADGNPTKAAEGFARGKGVAVADLTAEETDGGEYVFAIVEQKGRAALDVLPEMLATLVGDLDWPKSHAVGQRHRALHPPGALDRRALRRRGRPMSSSQA